MKSAILLSVLMLSVACSTSEDEETLDGESCFVRVRTVEKCKSECFDPPACTTFIDRCGVSFACGSCSPKQGSTCTWKGIVQPCYATLEACE